MKNSGRYLEVILPALIMLVIFSMAQSAWAVTPQIRAGTNHTVMLHSDGTIWTTGSNLAGQLGIGSGTTLRTSPVQVGNAANWMMVAAGTDHTLALKADGSLWTWGANQFGQLGDGTLINKSAPVQIGTGKDWTAVAAGGSSSFALKADGTLWAWGENAKGQLGDGTVTAKSLVPVLVLNKSSNGGRYVAISAGAEHTLALQADGSLWTWGSNQYGQIAQSPADTAAHSTPVQIGEDNWTGIAAGGSHSLAIRADGTLWAWGNNVKGQLGLGVTDVTAHIAPVKVGTDQDWASLSAGDLHTLATKRNGTLWAWGKNLNGQLGDGYNTDLNKPTQIKFFSDSTDITDIVAVAAGASHSLALKANGEIYGWGVNLSGQLGDGTTVGSFIPFSVGMDAIGSWVGTEPGGQFTAARRSDGTLWTWGDNASGQLGDNSLTPRTAPAMVGAATNWVAQATGWDHTVALQADGTLWAWGNNSSGQLGDNTTSSSPAPKQITVANNWAAVAAGDFHTLALKADGTLWAWGDNASGQLGDGTTTMKSVPVQINTGIGGHWVAIAAGGSHSMALQSDGTLWSWGDNSYGQLGDPALGAGSNPPFISTPKQIVNFVPPTTGYNSNWVAIAAGFNHSLALQADGTLWTWGGNFSGQLGNGDLADTPADKNVPVQVLNAGTSIYVAIAAGDSYSVAHQADGSLWSWGNNTSGQLGKAQTDATPIANSTPVRESSNANDWFSAGSGGSHTIALKANGTLSAWGSNAKGQLGDGTTIDKNSPAPLAEARIDVNPPMISYNIVAVGAVSSQNITIANKGAASLTVSVLTISGADSAMFKVISGGTCTSAPFNVPVAGSCTVKVAFNSAAPGGIKNATLTIASNDPNRSTETVEISGMVGITYTVTTTAANGSIAGAATVNHGSTAIYTITPTTGYHIADVMVDGVSQGAVTTLTLPAVTANKEITAAFVINTYTITAAADAKGHTLPAVGSISVTHGSNQAFAFTPATGYNVVNVIVDGVSQGPMSSYTFTNVTNGNHTIKLVTIPDGDLNNDGVVDAADALQALKIAVGIMSPTASHILHGDVAPLDASGTPVPDKQIGVADALLILRKAVGLTSGW